MTEPTSCPFERIGREYAAIDVAMNAIDVAQRPLKEESDEAKELQRDEQELSDRLRALDEMLSFEAPASMAGALVGLIVLGGLFDWMTPAQGLSVELRRQRRQFARIHNAVIRYLEGASGVDASQLGASWRRLDDDWERAKERLP